MDKLSERHPLFDKLYVELTIKYKTKDLSLESAVVLVGLTVQLVQDIKYKGVLLSGEDKKQLVTDLVVHAINQAEISVEIKDTLTSVFIPIILPPLINALCRLDVHKLTRSAWKKIRSCCC